MKPCKCGCGIEIDDGKTFVWGHNRKGMKNKTILRGEQNPNWKGGLGYVSVDGYHVRSEGNGKRIYCHRELVEKILGIALPINATIHHHDGNSLNNLNGNFVVCENQAYHMLLHRRARTLKECGHADWLRCYFCKQYDIHDNINKSKRMQYHLFCARKYQTENKRRKENENRGLQAAG
jgi:hypothetical protein